MLLSVSVTATFFGVRFQLSNAMQSVTFMILLLSAITLLSSFFLWLRFTLQQNRERNLRSLSINEWACIAYIIPSILYPMSTPLWNMANNDYVWNTRKESTLVFYMAMHFLYTVTVTSTIYHYILLNF